MSKFQHFMKKITLQLIFLLALLLVNISCKNEEPITTNPDKEVPLVSQFVYDGMSALYLWNKEVVSKKPTSENTDARAYFRSILNKTDAERQWSWITDDAEALVADFAGEPMTFGYSLGFARINNVIYAYVKYVHANTPAAHAGLQRLDLIGKLNGQPITANEEGYISSRDVGLLYGRNPVTFTIYRYTDGVITEVDEDMPITPIVTKTDPVVFDSIYTVGNKKVGYLFYTSFISNFNYRLHEVFSTFKQEGVTDLVLDLRYNHGGDISSASYLASMIASASEVEKKPVFTILSYNNDIGKSESRLGVYADKTEPNPLDANLDLDTRDNKVYIIATDDSYSASELITFCLRQFMDVVHIGGKTGGKYTGSITIHAYDDEIGFALYPEIYPRRSLTSEEKNTLENWAMQPIVAKYTDNKGNDFIDDNGLIPHPDNAIDEGFGFIDYWTPLGDTDDTLLGHALYIITGDEDYKPIEPGGMISSTKAGAIKTIDSPKIHGPNDFRKESVIIDNFRPKR